MPEPERDTVIRWVNPRSGKVHNADSRRLVTHCGAMVADIFATREYGVMTMARTNDPTTCKICLRGGVKGCHQ